MARFQAQKRQEIEQPLDKPYRLIPLTKGQVAIVDAADFEYLSQWNWWAHWEKNTQSFYAMRSIEVMGVSKKIKMHRAILGCTQGEEGDHIDGNTLNNRRSNLRSSTRSQNAKNQKLSSRNKTGYKGVYFDSRTRRWGVCIAADGKKIWLGRFSSKKDAA